MESIITATDKTIIMRQSLKEAALSLDEPELLMTTAGAGAFSSARARVAASAALTALFITNSGPVSSASKIIQNV